MKVFKSRRRMWTVIGAVFAVAVLVTGIVFLVVADRPTTPGSPGGANPTTSTPAPAPDVMTVTVYFHKGEPKEASKVVPVRRTVTKSDKVATAAVTTLLGGPTAAERNAGYWSMFSSATATMLRSVRVANGIARVDFADFRKVFPNASSSFGSTALLAELDATLKQFPTAKTTVYSFNGDVAAFYLWLQLTPPIGRPPDPAPAIAAARKFVTMIGMVNAVDGPFRWTGPNAAEVTFYARSPNGQVVKGQATVVSVRRGGGAWSVTGTATATIRVDLPARQQVICSPLRVSGRAHAFEGHVTVRVLQFDPAYANELGRGFVTGGGDQLRPFAGQFDFTRPDGGSGWVVFTDQSAANGEIIRATSVPVSFAKGAPLPDVKNVHTDLPVMNGWLTLPAGAGKTTFDVAATTTDRVEFLLTPIGSPTGPPAPPATRSIGVATKDGDRFRFTWSYPDEPLLAHLTITVTGPGGKVELQPWDVYHE